MQKRQGEGETLARRRLCRRHLLEAGDNMQSDLVDRMKINRIDRNLDLQKGSEKRMAEAMSLPPFQPRRFH